MWYRVFCRSEGDVPVRELAAALREQGIAVETRTRGDDAACSAVDFDLGTGTPVSVERYLTEADDLRNDLNTWAAYLETLDYSPNAAGLMERVIQTRQLLTVRKPLDHPNEVLVDRLCEQLCRALATRADGIYQVDNDGWYAADGSLLVKEY